MGSRWRGLALAPVLLAFGVFVGVASVATHHRWPLLVLTAVTLAAVMVALPSAWWSRPPFAVGFAVVVGLGMVPRPEGDYWIAADPQGYALLGVTLVLVVAALVTLPRPGARSRISA